MNIVELALTDIKPYENNPRYNDEAATYVAESIDRFGFKIPIIVDKDYVIIAGHTRYKAAHILGLVTVPCIIADDLDEKQVKAYRIADNRMAELSEWNFDKYNEEVQKMLNSGMLDDIELFDLFCKEEDISSDMFDLGAIGVYRLTIETDSDEDIEKIKEITSKYEGTEVKVNGH
jgi:ParB-like chromosome segregation protein Spo0J